MMGAANRAATFMEHLCECPEHGYSQSERWGDESRGTCYVECEGATRGFHKGDRDCSSAVIDAWQEALRGTNHEGCLNGASYTGNMRSVFCDSGLFEWRGMDFIAQRGDIYLDEANHTAMCVSADPDMLAEFSVSENGGIYGESGDQTGGESSIHGYYDFPWGGILHYNGGADGETVPECPDEPPNVPQPVPQNDMQTRYRVRTEEHGWLDWMRGFVDEGGSGDDFAGVEGCAIVGFEVEGFMFRIVRCDGSESENSQGTEDSPICGIEIIGDVDYQAHWMGDAPAWGKWEHGSDDGGAGKDTSSPLDMIRIR